MYLASVYIAVWPAAVIKTLLIFSILNYSEKITFYSFKKSANSLLSMQ